MCRYLSAGARGPRERASMAPARLGGDLRMMSPTVPVETHVDSGAPLKTEASVGNPGLWAEDRGTVGRPLMEAHYLKTVWQDCPTNEKLVAEYSRNVL